MHLEHLLRNITRRSVPKVQAPKIRFYKVEMNGKLTIEPGSGEELKGEDDKNRNVFQEAGNEFISMTTGLGSEIQREEHDEAADEQSQEETVTATGPAITQGVFEGGKDWQGEQVLEKEH